MLAGTWAIARRDLLAAFTTPLAWLIVAAWCVIIGSLTVVVVEDSRNIPLGSPPVAVILETAIWVLALLAPALSMTSFSNERQHGTITLLATAPIRPVAIVLGKFVGVWLQLHALIAACMIVVGSLMLVGHQPDGTTLSCFIAMWLVAGLIASFGVLIASLVESPVAAWVLTAAGLLLSLILAPVATTIEGSTPGLARFLRELALSHRLAAATGGELVLADLAFFIAGSLICLALTTQRMHRVRQHG